MNLDELRSVQSKERQTDSLQHLRESFYEDVSAYVSGLEDERDRAAERADDPFSDPEVRRLTDEIETAREVVEAIYDRRLGKLVKLASLAAADIPADTEGLTAEERELFDDLVERIEESKAHVLSVLDGESGDVDAGAGGHRTAGPDPAGTETGPAGPDGADREAEEARLGQDGVDGQDQPDVRTGEASDSGPPPRPDGSGGTGQESAPAGGDGGASPGLADQPENPGASTGAAADQANPDQGTPPEPGAGGSVGRDVDESVGRDVDGTGSVDDGGAALGEQSNPDPATGSNRTDPTAGSGRADATADDRYDPDAESGGDRQGQDYREAEPVDQGEEAIAATAEGGLESRTTVRVTGEVGEFYGIDGREYDLDPETVVALPAENAAPLLRSGDAERVD